MELDYGLSIIASSAAMAIDNYVHRESTIEDHYRIKELVEYLDTEAEQEFLSPTTQLMYAELFWPNKEDGRGKRQKDIQKEISHLAEELSELRVVSSDRQEQLIGVCTNLSNKVMAYTSTDYRRGLAA
jgi:hypothetical protein|tara:strand:- start:953 stop:1336 length:384 start_codon:yes stop_codon:yes gene_type:complete